MSSLSSCLSLTKNLAYASLPNNNNGSSSPPPPSLHATNNNKKLPMRSRTTPPLPGKKLQPNLQRRKPNQPSVIEIERVIGAGRFRDADNSDVEEENVAKFDMSMMNFSKFEGPVEKQLRETGEWVTNQTERGFRSNGCCRQTNSEICVLVDTTNLGFLTPSCRWSHQAKHPNS